MSVRTIPSAMLRATGVLTLAMSALWLATGVAEAKRLALVVGNGAYSAAPALKNPVNDAKAIADALGKLDFEVTLLTDVGTDDFWAELDAFTEKAETAESTVFYYSGHAFQMSGVNYLVPVSARLESREGITAETWRLDSVIARLQSRNRQTLVFLDACRNDPLPSSVRGSGQSDGLARVQTGVGTFVAFATEPGGVTADGIEGSDHSPFTAALLEYIDSDGMSISDMMIEVRNKVETATLRKQVPWDQSSLREQFYFLPPSEGSRQELSEADYELLAQLDPEDRRKFLDLLAQSGFDEASLAEAEAAISVAESNLQVVASQSSVVGGPSGPATPADAPTEGTQVADAPAEPTGLEGLQVVESDVAIGDAPAEPAPVEVAEAPAEVPEAPVEVAEAPVEGTAAEPETRPIELADVTPDEPAPQEPATIRLAALDFDTRDISINEVTSNRTRVEGRVVGDDNDSDRAILAAIDPRLLEEDVPVESVPEGELAAAVQRELKRVGCYQMKVDGSWGKGSRTALTSFFLAKRMVPDTLEPTQGLYSLVAAEPKVVCEVRVAKSAVKTGVRSAQAAEPKKAAASSTGKKGTFTSKNPNRPPETVEQRIKKSTIGMSGSF